jgi:hypothetical protein
MAPAAVTAAVAVVAADANRGPRILCHVHKKTPAKTGVFFFFGAAILVSIFTKPLQG